MKNEAARWEIEFLDYYLQNHSDDYSEESHTAMMMAMDALEQNTRQVARWVNNIHDLPICSKCGNYAVFDHAIDDYYYSDYCPKCGARMENAVEKIYMESEEE